jgi:hypothetical protein
MNKLSLHAIKSATKIIQTRRDNDHNPQNTQIPGGVPPNHLIPTESFYCFQSPGGMLYDAASIGCSNFMLVGFTLPSSFFS